MRYPMIRMSRFLHRVVDEVRIEPLATYRTAGLYSFGRGLFERPAVEGSQTTYRSFFRIHTDQFVYSKLFAWEGAIAVVEPAFDGLLVSPEFPTFEIDTSVVLHEYLRMLCRWPRLHAALAGMTSGLGVRRQRVNPEALLSVEVPIPDLGDQRRIVEQLDKQLRVTQLVVERFAVQGAEDQIVRLYVDSVGRIVGKAEPDMTSVGEVVEFVNDIVRPGEPAEPAEVFVGLQHVESHTGRRIGQLPLGGEKGRKFRFQPGDVVYGYLRPYLNKVWVADRHGLCSVDQYVLRSKAGATSDYLAHALRSRATLDQAIAMTHSLQLPRLRSGLLSEIQIPMVPAGMMGQVTADLDQMLSMVVQARDRRSHQRRLVDALAQSILNHAFTSPA